MTTSAAPPRTTPASWSRGSRRALLGAGLAVAAAALVLGTSAGWPAALAAVIVYAALAILVGRGHTGARFGAANAITLVRGVGLCVVSGLAVGALVGSAPGQTVGAVVVIGTVCLVLDGVDGRLARRRGEAGPFGARFDMETDAATLVALGVLVAARDVTGWWVLAIGAMRYANAVAAWFLPTMRMTVFYSLARKVVAVAQAVALLVGLALSLVPGAPPALPSVVAAVALAALTWSFGRDIVWQYAQARRPAVELAASAPSGPVAGGLDLRRSL